MRTNGKLKTVGRLRVGDRVMGEDGKPHTVTAIGNWGRGSRFLSIDGRPDGAMFCSDLVEVVERARKEEA